MQVCEAIEKRKSVRAYLKKPVPDDMVNELLEAARLAPSRHNNQPWKYFIVTGKSIEKLREEKIFRQDFVCAAPLIIICAATPVPYEQHGKTRAEAVLRACSDLSISSAFLVLRAEELGLGTCYIGLLDKKRVKPLVGVSDDYDVHFAITVGYSAEEPEARPRKEMNEVKREV